MLVSEAVRHFLCLVEPPSPFDSLEESRVRSLFFTKIVSSTKCPDYCLVTHWVLFCVQAFCETLEETNHRLQRELLENQKEVDALKKTLEEKEDNISLLVKQVK